MHQMGRRRICTLSSSTITRFHHHPCPAEETTDRSTTLAGCIKKKSWKRIKSAHPYPHFNTACKLLCDKEVDEALKPGLSGPSSRQICCVFIFALPLPFGCSFRNMFYNFIVQNTIQLSSSHLTADLDCIT